MSILSGLGGLFGNQAGLAGNQQQQQAAAGGSQSSQFGTAGAIIPYSPNSYQSIHNQLYQQQNIYNQLYGTYFKVPTVTYKPMYPISIEHIASGRRLVVWEE